MNKSARTTIPREVLFFFGVTIEDVDAGLVRALWKAEGGRVSVRLVKVRDDGRD